MDRVNLTVEEKYSPSWKLWEGLREMVQNWYDGLLATRESLRETICPLKLDIQKQESDQDRTIEYYASVDLPRRGPGGSGTDRRALGKICFHRKTGCLTLVNHKTELARKVLLLGYSHKPHCEEVIGQFGEGLKIGALALFREGRKVTLETSQDRWFFTVDSHKSFRDTRVLTVIVGARNQTVCDEWCDFPTCPLENLADEDTCTTISPITADEWETQAKRFLFLEPPQESVQTDQGTLMADRHLAGQVFVKGVWVNDMVKDGLKTGVDFYRMRLDRDRRAVVHKSDIDHQVSSMWSKALDKKPEWAGRYYNLLNSGDSCDVRHAGFYMQEPYTASLMANEFFKQHGQNALPLINTASADLLRKFTHDLKKEVVLCNQALLDILVRSGKVPKADSLLDEHKVSQQVKVPLASLSEDQMGVLKHMEDLVKIIQPTFNLSIVDIIQTDDRDLIMTQNSRIEIPHWMLDADTVAQFFPKAATEEFGLWRETQIASRILSRMKPGQEWLSGRADFSVQTSTIVMAALASQAHGKTKPFCFDRHKSGSQDADVAMWRQREALKDDQIQSLHVELHRQEEEHHRKLNDLMAMKSRLEKQVQASEMQHVDVRRELEHNYQQLLDRKLADATAVIQESQRKQEHIDRDYQDLMRRTQWQLDEYNKLDEKLEEEKAAKNRIEGHLKNLMMRLKEQLQIRLDQLIEEMNKEGDYSNKKLLQDLREVAQQLKEVEEKKDISCAVCKLEEKSHVLVPCGHFCLCETCKNRYEKEEKEDCPVCKHSISQYVKVFSS